MTKIENEIVLITGGSGSLGKGLVKSLAKNNEVIVFSRNEERQYLLKNEFDQSSFGKRIKFVIGDVRDTETLKDNMSYCTYAIHAAAMKDLIFCEDQVWQSCLNNISGSQSFLEAVKFSKKLKKVCGVSTDKAASPSSVYGCTKYIMEQLFIEASKYSDATVSIVRFGNMINSSGSLIPQWKQNPKLIKGITHPEVTRFFFTVEEAVSTVISTLKLANNGEIFIRKMKAAKIIDIIENIVGKKHLQNIPLLGLFPGEKVHEELLSKGESRFCEIRGEYFVIGQHEKNNDMLENFSTQNAVLFTKSELGKVLEEI